ncbi:proton-coupled thiamine transporter YuaJ, partial [gut metagenome]
MNKTLSRTRTLVECALMIALATILSYIPLVPELPHGGSITLVSMLPIIITGFRHGVKWGTLTAFVHSLIQLMLGIKNLTYCQGVVAILGCIFLDYILAYTVLGLATVFAKPIKKRILGVGVGS